MARETVHDLAGELAALLSRVDIAVRAGVEALRHRGNPTRPELRDVVATALRWFTHPAGPSTRRHQALSPARRPVGRAGRRRGSDEATG